MSGARYRRLVVALGVVLPLLAAMAWLAAARRPDVAFTRDVPADVRALVRRVSADVADALPARSDCLAGATLDTEWSLPDRARYLAADATIVLRIPATAAQLEQALIHEFAHHVEHTCEAHRELRTAFLLAQGLPEHTSWFGADEWEATPSEQYAEAMIVHVRGRRSFHRQMHVDDRAVAVVAAWAGCPVGGCSAGR